MKTTRVMRWVVSLWVCALAAEAAPFITISNGRWMYAGTNGSIVYYVTSSMGNFEYYASQSIDGQLFDKKRIYPREGEQWLFEQVPYYGFNPGTVWLAGPAWNKRTWTDPATAYRWGKLWTLWVPNPIGPTSASEAGYYQWGGGYTITLRASSGHYLCAESGGGQQIVADRSYPGAWEKFTLWATQSPASDFVLQAQDDVSFFDYGSFGSFPLGATAASVGTQRPRFRIYKVGGSSGNSLLSGDQVALRADSDKYVCAENGGGGVVNVNRDAIGTWETFTFYYDVPPAATSGSASASTSTSASTSAATGASWN